MDRTQPTPAPRHTIAVGILGRRAGRTIATVRTEAGTTGTVRRDDSASSRSHAMAYVPTGTPRIEIGETDTRRRVWSIRELDAVHTHSGGTGTVTARQIDQTTIEVTLAVGPVQVFTDWEPGEESYAAALPVIRALTSTAR
ncbi:hypothetical protein [Streptomyces sp. NPDC048196]|uniref:hypothetical protein n=1 Tax=Streptomyces sp. NPDC048196 TaxID=3154712 RepID=UPI0033BFD04A